MAKCKVCCGLAMLLVAGVVGFLMQETTTPLATTTGIEGSVGKQTRYRRVFAAVMESMMNRPQSKLSGLRELVLQDLHGTVLEIGPGTGVSFKYLAHDDVKYIGVENNEFMFPYLEEAASNAGMKNVRFVAGTAENMHTIADASVDVVVSNLVLCSVGDLTATLKEVHRVLRPGGSFVFLEHVTAPEGAKLRWFQAVINPIWAIFGDGCHLNRDTHLHVEAFRGFSHVQYEVQEHSIIPLIAHWAIGKAVK